MGEFHVHRGPQPARPASGTEAGSSPVFALGRKLEFAAQGQPAFNARPRMNPSPLVSIIMGSKSDWGTLRPAAEMLEQLDISHEARVVSAHRTPDLMAQFAKDAAARGIQVIIAGAGGAAHLPGMVAAHTRLPVLGVPVESKVLRGVDSLLSIVQMPAGIPVGTLAIGSAGAKNAALLAASILALHDESIREALEAFRRNQTEKVLAATLDV